MKKLCEREADEVIVFSVVLYVEGARRQEKNDD